MTAEEAVKANFEVFSVFGDEYVVKCPDPDHEDSSPSAWINVKKRMWICYSCEASGRLDDLLDLDLVEEVTIDEVGDLLDELEEAEEPKVSIARYINDERYAYWNGVRGLSRATIEAYDLGHDVYRDIPIYTLHSPTGDPIGVVQRNLHDEPKYRYPRGFKRSHHLYGLHRVGSTTLCITEGAIDALALRDAGYHAVAQLGSSLSLPQVELLRGLSLIELVCCFDNDQAGRNATQRVVELVDFCFVSTINWSDDGVKDVAEVSIPARQDLVDNRVPVGWFADLT